MKEGSRIRQSWTRETSTGPVKRQIDYVTSLGHQTLLHKLVIYQSAVLEPRPTTVFCRTGLQSSLADKPAGLCSVAPSYRQSSLNTCSVNHSLGSRRSISLLTPAPPSIVSLFSFLQQMSPVLWTLELSSSSHSLLLKTPYIHF